MVKTSVMCVQPLELGVDTFDAALTNNRNIKKFFSANMDVKPSIDWINSFLKIHTRSKNFKSILSSTRTPVSGLLLKADLSQSMFWVNDEYDISDNLLPKECKFDLIFDYRLYSFILVYELVFEFEEARLMQLLATDYKDQDKNNLYNTVRNLLVKEHNDSQISVWASQVVELAKMKTIECLKLIDNKRNHEVKLLNNTGNITFFYRTDAANQELKEAIFDCNTQAERVSYNQTTILDNDKVSYRFYSRFHSIISNDRSYYHRFFPIQYHIQYMWFSTAYFINLMDELNRRILIDDRNKSIEKNRVVIDEYINKFELLRIQNQDMKSLFESDNDKIYVPMESKWNICNALDNAQSYVASFKDYLERSYQRRMESTNIKQSKILFVISCIQLMGLVSIWNDYLSLSKVRQFMYTTGIHKDSQVEFVLSINTWFPIALFVGLLGFMIYSHYNSR